MRFSQYFDVEGGSGGPRQDPFAERTAALRDAIPTPEALTAVTRRWELCSVTVLTGWLSLRLRGELFPLFLRDPAQACRIRCGKPLQDCRSAARRLIYPPEAVGFIDGPGGLAWRAHRADRWLLDGVGPNMDSNGAARLACRRFRPRCQGSAPIPPRRCRCAAKDRDWEVLVP